MLCSYVECSTHYEEEGSTQDFTFVHYTVREAYFVEMFSLKLNYLEGFTLMAINSESFHVHSRMSINIDHKD